MPSYRSPENIIVMRMRNGISFLTVDCGMAIGYISAVVQSIRSILEILLQTIFEIARSVLPLNADNIFTTSSGADVPKATIVNQIISGDIPKRFATLDAPSTKKSAHWIRSKKPRVSGKYTIKYMK